MRDLKPYKVQTHTWHRLKIMCTILFFTGLRVGELKLFNRGKIMELINARRTDIFQPKTHSLRSVLLSKYGRQA